MCRISAVCSNKELKILQIFIKIAPFLTNTGEKKVINSELWHACAGPLVSLPPVGSLVVYFPQGHSEQVRFSLSLCPKSFVRLLSVLDESSFPTHRWQHRCRKRQTASQAIPISLQSSSACSTTSPYMYGKKILWHSRSVYRIKVRRD